MVANGFELLFGLIDPTSAAAAVSRGEVSSVELVDAVLARFDAGGADVNAVVVTVADWAREEARLPALAAPAGRTEDGLPVGLQIVGPPGDDHLIIDLVEHLAPILGPAA